MTRYLAALLALVATPAAATDYKVVGANPTPHYAACEGDTLTLRRPLGRELLPDGSRLATFSAWIDRGDGKGFEVDGATKLRAVSIVQAGTSVYAPIDAKPCGAAPTAPPLPPVVTAPSQALFGVNLNGAEASQNDSLRPKAADWQAYIEHFGFRLIRYPFKMERMAPDRIADLQANVAYAKSKGVPVILDRHDFQWRTPAVQIADWTSLARNFPDDGSVILEIVNEPKGFDDPVLTNDFDQWFRDSNLIIAGLRANGIRHPILLDFPGNSAAFRFDKSEDLRVKPNYTPPCLSAGCSIDRGGGLKDPLGLTYINFHRYFDNGSSGTSSTCTDKVSSFPLYAAQLRKRGLKAYITESGFGSATKTNAACLSVGAEAIAAIKANSDVLLGVTWWGGGAIWGDQYIYKIEPPKAVRFTAPIPAYTKMLTGQ